MAADSVTALVEDAARSHGTAAALVYLGETISYAALAEASRRVAGGLRAHGIGRGDRVALWLPNTPAHLILALALARLGAIAVAVNTRFRASEVEDIVGRSGAVALACWPGFKDIDFVGILGEVTPGRLDRLRTVIVYGEAGEALPANVLGRETVRYADLAAAAPYEAVDGDADTPCNIFTTSGTTKAPKFVLHGQRDIAVHARDVARAFGFGSGDAVILQSLPLCGVFGFSLTMSGLAGGARLVVQHLFDPAAAAEAIVAERVTHVMGTDDMFAGMLASRPEPRPFPSLRLCGFGQFNPALDKLLAECEARGVPMVGLYGMSECQALFAMQRLSAPLAERGVGGGFPVSAEAAVRVRNPETGELLPPGVSGELEVKGPSLMLGYADNPEATAAAMTEDGFLRTGDAGYLRPDGSFVFEARMGDVLRLAGFLTSPAEIEAFIEKHPAVAGVQVVGVLTRKGPKPFAFVVPRPGLAIDEADLRAFCRAGLANYKVPVRFRAIEEFPVTRSANAVKIQRHRLRADAQAEIERMEAGAA